MTSFLDVIAADDSTTRLASRKAVVVAQQRVAAQFGEFISQYGESALEYAADDIRGVVLAAAEEFGAEDGDAIYESVVASYKQQPELVIGNEAGTFTANTRTATSIHESRKTKMCPFHKDVVDISLAQGEPQAGFSAMSQHWGGPRHCEGDEYSGDKCNFKPQMTTQSYWDERKEKAEQRKQEREQAAELEAQQPTDEQEVTDELEETPVVEDSAEAPVEDNVIEVDFGGGHADSEAAPEASEPIAVAAKVATETTGLGGPEPTIDKRKWTPQTVREIDTEADDSPHPTKRKDVVEPIKPNNDDRLTEIGENVTERQNVETDTNPSDQGASTQTWTEGPKTAISGFLSPEDIQSALAHSKR